MLQLNLISPQEQPFDIEKFALWSRRWASSQREASEKKEEGIKAVQAHVDRMKDIEKMAKEQVKGALLHRFQAAGAEFHRREAEQWLAKEKAK
jgi:hypothetical protein